MSLFENLVTAATGKDHSLIPIRPVVEKEILHQEILRVMAESELLHKLVFIGWIGQELCWCRTWFFTSFINGR